MQLTEAASSEVGHTAVIVMNYTTLMYLLHEATECAVFMDIAKLNVLCQLYLKHLVMHRCLARIPVL